MTRHAWSGRWRRVWLAVLLLVVLSGCQEQDNPAPDVVQPAAATLTPIASLARPTQQTVRSLVHNHLQQASRDFEQAESAIMAFDAAVTELLRQPDTDRLNNARSAWMNAHNAWEATLLHRYLAEQVLPQDVALQLGNLAYQLNDWPILPGYVDAVENYPDSGLVHDINVSLDASSLRQVHGQFELSEAALGFHVLEFLLWGENTDRISPRPVSDFVPAEVPDIATDSAMSEAQLPTNRRRELLDQVSAILLSDFQQTRELWSRNMLLYQQAIDTTPASVLLSQLLQAINSMFTEELLVRSLYPLLNGNYSDSIQSPYSHSTQNAVVSQIATVERLLLDTPAADGTRMDTVLGGLSPDFEELFYANFDASKECLVLLYSNLNAPSDTTSTMQAEFAVVECINLLTNMIDHFDRIRDSLVQEQ